MADRDDLARRIADAEDELRPLRSIPELVAQHQARLDRVWQEQRDRDEQEVRRVEALRRDMAEGLGSVRAEMQTGFKSIREATESAAETGARNGAVRGNFRSNLALLIGVIGSITVPLAGIIVTIIATR
jgi:hypothetical protein